MYRIDRIWKTTTNTYIDTFVSQNLEEPIQESNGPLHHDAPQPFARGVQVLVLICVSVFGGIQPRRRRRLPPIERLRRVTVLVHITKREGPGRSQDETFTHDQRRREQTTSTAVVRQRYCNNQR